MHHHLLFNHREGCLYVKEPPGCSIEYARRGKYTMYLVTHRDKIHGDCPYILAHCQVEDCLHPKKLRSAARDMEVKLQLENEHHEVEVCLQQLSMTAINVVIYIAVLS